MGNSASRGVKGRMKQKEAEEGRKVDWSLNQHIRMRISLARRELSPFWPLIVVVTGALSVALALAAIVLGALITYYAGPDENSASKVKVLGAISAIVAGVSALLKGEFVKRSNRY
jgi:ActR/RegA family two-component response regulator